MGAAEQGDLNAIEKMKLLEDRELEERLLAILKRVRTFLGDQNFGPKDYDKFRRCEEGVVPFLQKLIDLAFTRYWERLKELEKELDDLSEVDKYIEEIFKLEAIYKDIDAELEDLMDQFD